MHPIRHANLLILLANQHLHPDFLGILLRRWSNRDTTLGEASGIHCSWFKDYIQYMQVHKVIDRQWAVAFPLPCRVTQLVLSLLLLILCPPLFHLGSPFIQVILDLLDPPRSRYGVFLIPFLDLASVALVPLACSSHANRHFCWERESLFNCWSLTGGPKTTCWNQKPKVVKLYCSCWQ